MLTPDMFRDFVRDVVDADTRPVFTALVVSRAFYDKVVAKEPTMAAYLVVSPPL